MKVPIIGSFVAGKYPLLVHIGHLYTDNESCTYYY